MSQTALRIKRCAHSALRVDPGRLIGQCSLCGRTFKGADLIQQMMTNHEKIADELARAHSVVFEMTAKAMEEQDEFDGRVG